MAIVTAGKGGAHRGEVKLDADMVCGGERRGGGGGLLARVAMRRPPQVRLQGM